MDPTIGAVLLLAMAVAIGYASALTLKALWWTAVTLTTNPRNRKARLQALISDIVQIPVSIIETIEDIRAEANKTDFDRAVEAEMANIARVEELRRQFDEAEERRQAITAEAKRRLSQS